MNLLTSTSPLSLWQEVVKDAEDSCRVMLEDELEAYLVSLLLRYSNRPDVAKQLFAKAFLEALELEEKGRHVSLQHVGDQCLLFAGLFPKITERKLIKIKYLVDLGQSAYASLSHHTNDLYGSLALQFVVLMDVLQSIRQPAELLPLEAYEQWQAVGSQRSLRILQTYTKQFKNSSL